MLMTASTAAFLSITSPAKSEICIYWPTEAEQSENPTTGPEKALGKPDGESPDFSNGPKSLPLTSFTQGQILPSESFSALFGIPAETLLQYDFVAFEFNGPQAPSDDLETSVWVFSGAGQSETFNLTFGEDDPNTLEGSIEATVFEEFFDFERGIAGQYSYALFNFQTVDANSEDFRVVVTAEGSDQPSPTTPDIDAMGILSSIDLEVCIKMISTNILSFETMLGVTYELESSPNLRNFTSTGITLDGTGEVATFNVINDATRRFYRVRSTLGTKSP